MALTWRGTIEPPAALVDAGQRRKLQFPVEWRVGDTQNPDEILLRLRTTMSYPAEAFRDLTRQQAFLLVRDQGVGEIPSLMDIGDQLLADYQAAAVIRQLPQNYEFGP